MIQIDSVEIRNFKSIINYKFDFNSIDIDNAKCGIFVGLNESGKSAFLEAMSLINTGLKKEDFYKQCNNDAQDNQDKYLDLYVNYTVNDSNLLLKNIHTTKLLDASIIKKLKIKKIFREMFIGGRSLTPIEMIRFEIDDINIGDFYSCTVNEVTANRSHKKKAIFKDIPSGQDSKKATQSDLNEILSTLLKSEIDLQTPKIQFWKISPEFLINEEIDLNEFMEDPEISIPLRNIFNVYGKSSKEDIKSTLEKALKNPAKRDELVEKISESITKHINKIWKEHKIKIRVSINGDKCNVLVEDQDNRFSYFGMNQRSDGFKQFISLILSLSTLNESNSLKNNIILIDEPEVHLHPSGIMYMRDELLKIAKK